MKKMNGFTLIELMIVVAIIGVIASILGPLMFVGDGPSTNPGMQGPMVVPNNVTCINGFTFVNGAQMFSSDRAGVPCSTN